MIIFLDEDRSYHSWVTHHRSGFVLDGLRKPTRKRPVLHRATCADVRLSKTKRTHWTTGRHLKACSSDLDELVHWAQAETGSEPDHCQLCNPRERPDGKDAAQHDAERSHLTKLGAKILDFIVETAVIHLDQQDGAYCTTAGDVARCLDKSSGQIRAPIMRLIDDGYLRSQPKLDREVEMMLSTMIFPTQQALRMLPAFAEMTETALAAELDQLEN